jgi:hypothetical protein
MNNFKVIPKIINDKEFFGKELILRWKEFESECIEIISSLDLLMTGREKEVEPVIKILEDFTNWTCQQDSNSSDEKVNKRVLDFQLIMVRNVFRISLEKIHLCKYFSIKEIENISQNIHLVILDFLIPRLKKNYLEDYILLNTLLNSSTNYYNQNIYNNNLNYDIFGVQSDFKSEYINWINDLKIGEHVDCIKFYRSHKIWSRGEVAQNDKYQFKIKYLNSSYETYLQNRVYEISPLETMSKDFKWRNKLKIGDLIEYNDQTWNWVLGKITNVFIENDLSKEIKFVEIISVNKNEQEQSNFDSENFTKLEVHSPLIREIKEIKNLDKQIDYSEDNFYLNIEKKEMFAIVRTAGENSSSSKMFVKLLNIFGEKGGFDLILNKITDIDSSLFINNYILEFLFFCGENLTQPLIIKMGDKVYKHLILKAIENIELNIREISEYTINIILKVSEIFLRRNNNKVIYLDLFETICLNLFKICFNSEILKKQLLSIDILEYFCKLINQLNDSTFIKNFVLKLKSLNILSKILKGHESLFSKASYIFEFFSKVNYFEVSDILCLINEYSKTENEKKKKILEFILFLLSTCTKDLIGDIASKLFDSNNVLNIINIDIILEIRKQVIKNIENKEYIEEINLKILDLLQSDNQVNKSDHVKIIINLIEENDNYNIISKFLNLFISNNINRVNLVLLDDLLEENINLNKMIFEKVKTKNFLSQMIDLNQKSIIDCDLLWELIFVLCKHNRYLSFINYIDFLNIWKMSKYVKNQANMFFNHVIESKVLETFPEQLKNDFKIYFDDFWENPILNITKSLVFENIFRIINIFDKNIKVNKYHGKSLQKYGSNKMKIRLYNLVETSNSLIYFDEWWIKFESNNFSIDVKINKIKSFLIYLFPFIKENINSEIYVNELNKLKNRAYGYLNNNDLNFCNIGLALSNIIFEFEEMFLYINMPFIQNLEPAEDLIINFDCNFSFRNNLKIKIRENKLIRDLYLLIGEEICQEINTFELVYNNVIFDKNKFNHVIKMYGIKSYTKINIMAKAFVELKKRTILTDDGSSLGNESVDLLKRAFSQYSFNDQMTIENLAQYQSYVTSKDFNKDSYEVIKTFKKIISEDRNYILIDEFINFYEQAAKGAEYTYNDVYNNLKKLGFKDRSSEFSYNFDLTKTFRFHISNDLELINKLVCHSFDISFNSIISSFLKLLYPSFEMLNNFINGTFNINYNSINLNILSIYIITWYNLWIENEKLIKLMNLYLIEINEFSSNKLKQFSLDIFIPILLEFPIEYIDNMLIDDLIILFQIISNLIDLALKIKDQDSYEQLKNFNSYFIEKDKLSKISNQDSENNKSKVRFKNEDNSPIVSKTNLDEENQVFSSNTLYISIIKDNYQTKFVDLFIKDINLFKIIFKIVFSSSISSMLIDNHKSFYRLIIKSLAQLIKINYNCLEYVTTVADFECNIIDKLIQNNTLIKIMHKNFLCFLLNEDKSQSIILNTIKNITQRLILNNENQFFETNTLLGFILDSVKSNQSKINTKYIANLYHSTFHKIFYLKKNKITLIDDIAQVKSCILVLLKLIKFDKSILNSFDENNRWALVSYLFKFIFNKHGNDFNNKKVLENKDLREILLLLFKKIICSENKLIEKFLIEVFPGFIKNIPVIPSKVTSNSNDQASENIKSETGYVGIKNPGCICYMNAILQQLFCIPTFRSAVFMTQDGVPQKLSEHKDFKYDDNLYHQIQRLFSYLSISKKKYYHSTPFVYSYKDWDGNPTDVLIQHDADEFLKVIIDKVESVMKSKLLEPCFNSVFGGKLCNIIVCQNCNYQKLNEEVFYDLSMEIKGHTNLNSSLMKLIEPEYISEYNCESCKKKCDIIKKSLLKVLPNVLFIYLKKIVFDLEELINKKIHSKYEFTENLNLKPFIFNDESTENLESENFDYILTGVVIHRGNADFGHYTSLINIDKKGKWLEFDDANVTYFDMSKFKQECFGSEETQNFYHQPSSKEINMSKSAYILVYEKVIKNKIKFNLENNNCSTEEIVSKLKDKNDILISNKILSTSYDNIRIEIPKIYEQYIEEENTEFLIFDLFLDKNLGNTIFKLLKKTCINTSQLLDLDPINEKDVLNSFKSFSYFYQFLLKVEIKRNDEENLIKYLNYLHSFIELISNKVLNLKSFDNISNLLNNFSKNHIMEKWKIIMNILFFNPKEKIKELMMTLVLKLIDLNFYICDKKTKKYDYSLIEMFEEKTIDVFQSIFDSYQKGMHPIKFSFPLHLLNYLLKYPFLRKCTIYEFDISEFINLYITIDSQKIFNSEETLSEILFSINIFYAYVKFEFKNPEFKTEEFSNICELNDSMTVIIKKLNYEEYNSSQLTKIKNLIIEMAIENNELSEQIIFMILSNFENNSEIKIFTKLEIAYFLIQINDKFQNHRISNLLGVSTLIESNQNIISSRNSLSDISSNKISLTKIYNYVSSRFNKPGIIQYLYNLKFQNKTTTLLIINFILKSSLIDNHFLKYVFSLKPEKANQKSIVEWFKEYIDKYLQDNVYPSQCNFSDKIENMASYLGELSNVLSDFEIKCNKLKESEEFANLIPDPVFNLNYVLKEQSSNSMSIPDMNLFR